MFIKEEKEMKGSVVNKDEMAIRMARKTGGSIPEMKRAIEAFAEACKEAMEQGNTVNIREFIKISRTNAKGRNVRMPSGKLVQVPERLITRATVSKSWR